MFNPFRKNPEPAEPPLSNEEIEASYFPGTVPAQADPDLSHLQSLRFTDEGWESTAPGVLFVIAGDTERPNSDKLHLAKAVLGQFAKVEAEARQVARVFIRDEGSWSVDEINLGLQASKRECDFLVRLSFSPSDGSSKYGYTSFSACFVSVPSSAFHVRSYVIEFL